MINSHIFREILQQVNPDQSQTESADGKYLYLYNESDQNYRNTNHSKFISF